MTCENGLNLRALLPKLGITPPPVEQVIASYNLFSMIAREAIPAHPQLPIPTLIPVGQK